MHRAPPTERTPAIRRLEQAELPTETVALARFLIGKTLVHDQPDGGRLSGRIVETEAYPVGDASGHAFVGETRRNRSLFLDRGYCYVYLGYGLHYLCNVASEQAGIGAGVLLRALEPVSGIEIMEQKRGTTRRLDLARGPGRLAQAMGIDLRFDGIDLCTNGTLWLGTAIHEPGPIGSSIRIGISKEVDRIMRFYERGNPHVSGSSRLNV
ncbi:MAG TPA: DNA-3-methyladenine glycosylase [Xanthobacteraceae bacterium]|jgi:DNA-3-methyladenine glycosylase|nr:DNA-3-methyladenine glycosylase [Xanthobacteraceae bacterium]